ncbi:MAG TPA: PIN domain-containing protein [Longimicrobium sp.]|nr:PIN domain-containing protein [Longimicrobium sp.]
MRGAEPAGAVLDANVLYSAFARDVLLRLAAVHLFRPYWSERIHEEWTRNLLADRPDLSPASIARTRASMDAHFPYALVTGHEGLEEGFEEVARTDRHVAAAARTAGADYIVTHNVRDFPADALHPHGIAAVTPDEFVRMLVRQDAVSARAVLEVHRLGLHRPPLDPGAYRAAFILNGLSRSAALLWP